MRMPVSHCKTQPSRRPGSLTRLRGDVPRALRQAVAMALAMAIAQLSWTLGAEAVTVMLRMPRLRGGIGGGEWLGARGLSSDQELPWWFYLLMPFISGAVGYGTNVVVSIVSRMFDELLVKRYLDMFFGTRQY